MSKFEKRILISSAHCRNSLVVGSGLGYLPDLITHCNTVFVIDSINNQLRTRNVVNRKWFTDLQLLTDIDFIFVDANHFHNIPLLKIVFDKFHPVIILEGTELPGVDNHRLLQSSRYSLIEVFKNVQKWIPQ